MWRDLLIDFCVFNDHHFNCRGLCSVELEGKMMVHVGFASLHGGNEREAMAREQAREPQGNEGCDLFKALVMVSLGELRETVKGL
jgi:hypothetical protein